MANINDYNKNIIPFYRPANFIVNRAKGSFVWDKNNKKYIDFTAGIAVTNLGHNNKDLVKVLNDQAKQLWHLSPLYINQPAIDLSKKLCNKTFADRVYFCNSGAESVESAIKIARKYTSSFHKKKSEIISFSSSFHGRTMTSISLAKSKHLTEGFAPLLKGIRQHKYNKVGDLEKHFSENTSAVILELVQWHDGIIKADKKFLTEIKRLSKKYKSLIIIDEVQSGIGRTGTFFAYEQFNIKPDILCFAKGIANGFPIGGVLTTEKISKKMSYGSHGTTFGGGPIACAIGSKVVDLISKKKLLGDVFKKEKFFLEKINEFNEKYECFEDVKSAGLWISIHFNKKLTPFNVDELIAKCHSNGLMILKANETSVRFSPSLIIENDLIVKGMKIFHDTVLSLLK